MKLHPLLALLGFTLTLELSITAGLAGSSPTAQLTAAFGSAISIGHPGVFGEQYSPPIDAFIPLLMAEGFTLERLGVSSNKFLPDTTLAQYKANINGAQDPANWDFSSLAKLTSFAASPTGKNMKFMLTFAYIPAWLSYDSTNQGVPRDWVVYVDIMTKIFTYIKAFPSVKYIEVWNEPTGQFLHIGYSPYASKTDGKTKAYMDIYRYTVKAIRAAGLQVAIGGPAGGSPSITLQLAEAMFSNTDISTDIAFLSYHNYDGDNGSDGASEQLFLAFALAHGRPDLAVFVTEWNYSWKRPSNPLNSMSTDAISYVGRRLTNFLASGATGATMYHMGQSMDNPGMGLDGEAGSGLFTNLTFMPKIQTFRLMSVILGLGKGQSQVMKSNFTVGPLTAAVAAINNASQPVLCLTNEGTTSTNVSLNLKGLLPNYAYSVSVWEASAFDFTHAVRETLSLVTNSSGASSTGHVAVKGKSVVGMVFSGSNTAQVRRTLHSAAV